jgi:hypothetical protein
MNMFQNPQALAFKQSAEAFCEVCNGNFEDSDLHLQQILAALAKVYALGFSLPPDHEICAGEHLEPTDEQEHLFRSTTHQNRVDLFKNYHASLDEPSDPNAHTVLSDLSEIYDDLNRGLMAWKTNQYFADYAVFEWKHSHRVHWGVHAVQVMKCLHYYEIGIQNDWR